MAYGGEARPASSLYVFAQGLSKGFGKNGPRNSNIVRIRYAHSASALSHNLLRARESPAFADSAEAVFSAIHLKRKV